MPLKIIYGTAGTGKTYRCLSEIAELCNNDPLGTPLYLLVPEQASFEAEKQLAVMCGGGFMRAQAFGFKRFALRVMNERGMNANSLSDSGRRMIIRRILQQAEPELKAYCKTAKHHSLANELAALFRELKNSAVAPEDLVAQDADDCPEKIRDISLLYTRWEQHKAANNYADPEDYLLALPAAVAKSELLTNAKFWIDGFSFFTAAELRVVEALLAQGACVTITLCIDDITEANGDDTELFHQQQLVLQRLREKFAVDCTRLVRLRRFDNPDISVIGAALAGYENHSLLNSNKTAIVKADNKAEEADWIARMVISLVRDRNLRWRDIAIVGREIESYRGVLEAAFKQNNIPYAFDQPRSLAKNIISDFLRAVIDIRLHNWNYHSVFSAVKTGLFEDERCNTDDLDVLENYVLKYGLRGARAWRSSSDWNYERAADDDAGAQGAEDNQRINRSRNHIVAVVDLFCKYSDSLTVKQYIERLQKLLTAVNAAERAEQLAQSRLAGGDLVTAAGHRKVIAYIDNLFAEMIEVADDVPLSLEDFSVILAEGLDAAAIKITPPGLDYVAVCAIDRMKMPERQALFLFGLNDGIIPAYTADAGILTATDCERLSKLGVQISLSSAKRSFTDKFTFYAALMQAREYLYLCYPVADNDGKALNPSLLVEQLASRVLLTKNTATKYALLCGSGKPESLALEYFSSKKRALAELARLLRARVDIGSELPLWAVVYQNAVADNNCCLAALDYVNQSAPLTLEMAAKFLLDGAIVKGSVSRLEAFIGCPFKYFARYLLKLQQREQHELEALDIGNVYHAVLKNLGERFVDGESKLRIDSVEQEVLLQECRELFFRETAALKNQLFLSSGYSENLQERLYRRFEKVILFFADFSADSRFKAAKLEQKFGEGSDWQALQLADASVRIVLNGVIDRIDSATIADQKYSLVVDYKSAQMKIDLVEFYHGLKLQLPLYLSAVKENMPDSTVAGIMYMGMKDDRINVTGYDGADAEDERYKKAVFQGLFAELALDEQTALLDFVDQPRSQAGKGDTKYKHINVSAKKKTGSNVRQQADFELLMANAKRQALKAAMAIRSGNCAITPVEYAGKSACAFCEYSPACLFDVKLDDKPNPLPKVDKKQLFESLHSQLTEGGTADVE